MTVLKPSPSSPPPASAGKPQWLWAILTVAAFSVLLWGQADLDKWSAYDLGKAIGSSASPLLIAWLATRIWKWRHVPTVVAASAIGLMIASGNTGLIEGESVTHAKIGLARKEASRALKATIASWRESVAAWNESGGCAPSSSRDHPALTKQLDGTTALRESTLELLSELETGDNFLIKLHEAGAETSDAQASWSRVKASHEIGITTQLVGSTAELLKGAMAYLSGMEQSFGQWSLTEDGNLAFEPDTKAETITRINNAVDSMQQAKAKIVTASESAR